MTKTQVITEVINVTQFAELIGISKTNAYKLVHANGFPAFRPTPGCIRIAKEDAIEWLRKHQTM
ncbi:helix-turn-helix transcriptional regulator [Gudongella sp. DL1XJH-153]|uniref:helix-turn-helix transcriptional regulator n=1 Tax=Gudongella sp. DL1XJH-153 TaxID=3409804 RepID=UPI003BB4FB54